MTRRAWSAFVLLVAAFVVAPVVAVIGYVTGAERPALPADLGAMIATTLFLMLAVGLGTLVIGAGLAWLVTAYTFPLRNVFVWLLVLPLAMPAYILGFTFLSTFDEAGPVQGAVRAVFGDGFGVSVATLPGCAVVMSLTLYPYVFLMARAAFAEQAPTTYDAARVLGASRTRAFFRVLLPLARPSIAAGLVLVMMEVLTDFATVQYFGVQTVSYGVYLVWTQTYDFAAAAQLATLVMLFAVAVIMGERLFRGRAAYTQKGGRGVGLQATPLPPLRAALAVLACSSALLISVAVPILRLVEWGVEGVRRGDSSIAEPEFATALANSVTVAILAAVACVVLTLLIGHALRLSRGRVIRAAAQLTAFGYGVPGAVVAIGVVLLLKALNDLLGLGIPVTGSVLAVLAAYVVRFLGPAYQALDASFAKLTPSVTQSALSLGAGPLRVLRAVHAPLVRPGMAVALVIVAVDAIKELPLVLMLRPFGFTTVSIWVHQRAKENLWEQAALPALVIVLLAIVPVFLLFRQVRGADRAHRLVGGR